MTSARPAQLRLRPSNLPVTHLTMLGLGVTAWILLIGLGHLSSQDHGHHHQEHMGHMASDVPATPMLAMLAATALMVIAMMAFGLAPMARYVRTRTLRRRWWATPTVLLAYAAVWLVLVPIVTTANRNVVRPHYAVVVLLAAAAAWELTPIKRWSIDACQRTVPLALCGPRATGSEIWFGAHQAAICVASCWLIMLPMLIGAGPVWLVMGVGTAAMTAQRLTTRPNRTRRINAALLAGAALAVAIPSLIGG